MRDVSADEPGAPPPAGRPRTASTTAASDAGSPGDSPPPYATATPPQAAGAAARSTGDAARQPAREPDVGSALAAGGEPAREPDVGSALAAGGEPAAERGGRGPLPLADLLPAPLSDAPDPVELLVDGPRPAAGDVLDLDGGGVNGDDGANGGDASRGRAGRRGLPRAGDPPPTAGDARPGGNGRRPDATGGGGGGGRTFAALEDRTYRLLWLGGLFGFLAVQMEFLARGWVASELTGSNTGLGLVFLGFGVPMLLLTPWGGVAADRLPKRTVLMACQLALASSSAIVAVTTSLGLINYPILVGTAVIQGAGFSFLGPARMAFTGELVGQHRLANAIVLQQMSMNGTRVIGPSVAGALIGISAIGAAGVYYLTTALMVFGMVLTLRLPPGNPRGGRPVRSPAGELADGVRYVLHRPLVGLLAATSLLVVMFAFPYVAFLPRLAKDTFDVGADGFGLLSAASAVGALGASLFIAGRADGPRAWTIQTVAGIGFGVGVALLAFAPSFAVALVVILLTGAASSAFQSLNNSLVLSNSDPAYHGRVQSLMMLSFSAFGIAAMPLGAIADAIGLDMTMLGMGALACISIVAYAVLRPIAARAPVPATTTR